MVALGLLACAALVICGWLLILAACLRSRQPGPCHRGPRLNLLVGPISEQKVEGAQVMSLILTDSQQVALAVTATDKRGNPTGQFDQSPSWSVSDPNILAVAPAVDGMSAVVSAAGPLGAAQVNVTALVNGNTIAGTLDVEVHAGEAVNISLVAGAPSEQ